MLAAHSIDQRIAAHHDELVAFLRRRSPSDAEELAQEVWIRVSTRGPQLVDDRSFRAYTYTVARRLLIDAHRRRSARITLVHGEVEPDSRQEPMQHSAVAAQQALHVVRTVLDQLTPEQREVFELRTYDHVPFKEIAERQRVSVNTALGRMHAAVKRLNAALAAEGWKP